MLGYGLRPNPTYRRRSSRCGTSRAGVRPGLDQLAELLLGARRRRASRARGPAPPDKLVVRHVLDQRRHVLAAVAVLVLDLHADLAERLALPGHLGGRERPFRI